MQCAVEVCGTGCVGHSIRDLVLLYRSGWVGGWEEEGRRGRGGQLCWRECPILRSVYTKCSTPKRAGHCEPSDIVVPIRVFEV